jgi:hypothetical protein
MLGLGDPVIPVKYKAWAKGSPISHSLFSIFNLIKVGVPGFLQMGQVLNCNFLLFQDLTRKFTIGRNTFPESETLQLFAFLNDKTSIGFFCFGYLW